MKRQRVEPDYKDFVKDVMQRDNFKCQMPYCDNRKSLVVHHIKPYSTNALLRTSVENGITLCRKCHKQVFGKEKRFAPIFLQIIREKP